ncbi:MAG: DNRLRE domain-containing protein, partial [Gemmatimonadetes bacterium]|nr:DNRLRE domain-containing protein [Gemmatimonadota bacterium]
GDDRLVYQLIEGWVEATVTWNEASTGVSWTNAGADGTGSHKATAVGTLSGVIGSNSVDVTTSVQNWSFGELNEGWLLKDTGGDGVDIRSSEYGTAAVRPRLTVTYSANTAPTVASAIPDTTVNHDAPPIDNYRDLKAVFTDVEEGSALTFTIESNTNTGLVTATFIPADSTLDLSFTASTSGTATITIRATDSGGLFVEDVFTVTVNAAAVLLGRYWFNEAPSGQAPATVLDDQASPVNLSVTYDTLAWRLDASHRGLGVPVAGRINNLQHAGIAKAPVEGTKYKTNLDGATAATFVVVAEWEGGWSDRMAGFQRPGGGRILLVLTDASGGLEFRTDSDLSNPRMIWPAAGWDDAVRRVFHFVYDTDNATDSLRMRLYVDGVDQGIPGEILSGLPSLGDGLNWGFTDIDLIALNEQDFTNGFPGTVFYMAVYDGVMTDAAISADHLALIADDDNITYAVDVTLDGVDSLPRLPSNGTAYSYKYTVTNNSSVIDDFDLFGFPGDTLATFLTVDSITGPNVTQGAVLDSARVTGIAAGASDSAFVWYTVANVAAGTLDSLYLNGRSIRNTAVSDPGSVFIQVIKPNMTMVKAVSPNGTQLPGTDLTYTVTITNDGSDDAVSAVIVDSLPAEVEFKVGTVVNNLPTGVTATVEYSNDGASTWTYTPVSAGCSAPTSYDGCVTHIRWTLQNNLSSVGPDNTGNVQFVARIT